MGLTLTRRPTEGALEYLRMTKSLMAPASASQRISDTIDILMAVLKALDFCRFEALQLLYTPWHHCKAY